MGLFVDLIRLDEQSTNDALELMCKSHHNHDDGIWSPLDSPFIAQLVALFTQRGLDRLASFQHELTKWATGQNYKPGERIVRPQGVMERWTPAEVALVKLYLEHLPSPQWTLDDHMLAVDYLAHKYLPLNDMRTEAEWLATRSSLMGRVQANMTSAGVVTSAVAEKLLIAMPTTAQASTTAFGANAAQRATMDYAVARCAENVRELSNNARHRMRNVIIEHVQAQQLNLAQVTPAAPTTAGAKIAQAALESVLLDEFAVLNRDWRRIAVTEAGEAQTQGYIASMPLGAQVKRMEQYRGACAFCSKINNKILTVVDPAQTHKDPNTMVWPGKNNMGRSASPRKRIGQVLKEREPHEMWQIPAGLVHPHCRGSWVAMPQARANDDPQFSQWLRGVLESKPTERPV